MTMAASVGARSGGDMGDVVRRAVALVRRHPLAFLGGGALLVGLPRVAQQAFVLHLSKLAPGIFVRPDSSHVVLSVLLLAAPFAVTLALTALYSAWMCRLALASAAGGPATPASSLVECSRRAGPIILAGLAVAILTLLGAVVLIVPGVFFSLASFLTIPALTMEELRPFDAIRRSFDITQGRRGTIFLLSAAIVIAELVATILAELALVASGHWNFGNAAIAPLFAYALNPLIIAISQIAFAAVAVALYDARTSGAYRPATAIADVFS
ncbi:hypothetical protein [Phenylobacterium montanum]|uniref:Glycerophosphoryl diester phosphodiesterase membrane domain-containing protein n=1 Tax=Phenylobacterium montanum TaxID=2823693 RepID=A0A975IW38_9CAUL|nr:hypothetical protein [Caulobacter sp. S6]QUD89204.1 hypothetical protein KCG34_04800 [Caulobacter sp. S6]